MSIEKLKQNHHVVTKWVHYPLHPDTPPEGVLMKDIRRHTDESKATGEHLRALMSEAGLPYGKRTRLDNSRLAQELGAWADTQDGGEALHDTLFRAYFAEDRNLGDKAVLLQIVEEVGLDTDAAREVLDKRLFSTGVAQDWEKSWQKGITGVPTFFSRDLFVYGCQPYEVLERFYNHLVKLRNDEAS